MPSTTDKSAPKTRASWAGTGLVLLAGVGTTIGLLVGGGAGIALGAAFGAAVGLVLGAVVDGWLQRR